jgi:hypothetical protein
MCICVCMYVCMYLCNVCVCVCVCMYVCMYVCMFVLQERQVDMHIPLRNERNERSYMCRRFLYAHSNRRISPLIDKHGSRGSSVSIVTRLRAGRPGFDSRQEQEYLSLRHRVQTDSKAYPASYPVGSGAISPGIKRPVG